MQYKPTYSGQRQQHPFTERGSKKEAKKAVKERYESIYSSVHKQKGKAEHQAAARRNMVTYSSNKDGVNLEKQRIVAAKNAVSDGRLYDESPKPLEQTDTAVNSGDMYTDKPQIRQPEANSVSKNNGLRNASFERRTPRLYSQGIERTALKRRRTNYRGKSLDEQLSEQVWRLMRTTMQYRNEQKHHSLYDLLGCELKALKLHLANHFEEGMSWSNYGQWVVVQVQQKPENEGHLNEEYWHYSNMKPAWR